ncbi:MAG: M1 family metallopeptidase [Ignavibacteriales bacterium]|nr:M1 family metallopeptidase [Ignavibacteriales bacterium]
MKSILRLQITILFIIYHWAAMTLAQPNLSSQPLSPRIANYDIDVRLDPQRRMFDGHEVLTWFNKTTDKITELQFHLYLNAFRNNKSTFMKESGRSSRDSKEDIWGFSEIKKLNLSTGEDLTRSMEFIHPDDDNTNDKTVCRVTLPKTLSPGDSIKIIIDFTSRLPQPPSTRSGAKEEYFFVSQWFPKAGVYIDGKWNCRQYHANGEFFADFGVYDVRITVPEKNVVGATGTQVEIKNKDDGTATHYYHAEDVHDFAWTTSPEFVEFTGRAQDVDIRVLMQPDHIDQGLRHLEAAKVAVEYFQNWYGDYPYPNLTVVDPRRGAGGSGGMEYPTLITAGTTYGLPEGIRMVEMVIIHEFGHNYWYHLLASNEFEESWLDEGINTYTENQIISDHYGTDGNMMDLFGIKINDLQFHRAVYMTGADFDPTIRNSWQYYSGSSYGINSYMKPGLFLTTLHNYLGKETMKKIMRTYSERWRFKHPRTKDFITVANEVSGQDLNWFFEQALYSNAVLDYSIDVVSCKEIEKDKGFDYSFSTQDAIEGKELTHNTMENEKDGEKLYLNIVKVRRLGAFKFPLELEMVFENGEKIRERWDGQELWMKYRYIKSTKLVSATVDPDYKIPLDINLINNSKTIEHQTLGVNKLAVRFLFWVQFILDQPEFLNLYTFLQALL